MAGRSGPPGPSPARATEPAWVALAALVTGLFQFDSDDGAAVVGAVAVGLAVSPAGVSVAVLASGPAAGASAAAVEVSGAGADDASGAGGAGSQASASGLAVLVGRGSSGPVAAGAEVQPSEQPGAVVALVAASVGSGESAKAVPLAGKVSAIASTAADAVAETARRSGDEGVMGTFRCAQSPVCGFRVSK